MRTSNVVWWLVAGSLLSALGCGGEQQSGQTGADDDDGATGTPEATPTATATPAPTPPADACVSDFNWVLGDFGSSWMHPGLDCVGCHATSGGPDLWIGGTVYGADRQDDDCGGASGIEVEITEADGTVHTLTTTYTGNFYLEKSAAPAFQFPYTVTLSAGGETRSMATPQSTGACNSCHTPYGASGAPGRVLAPGI